MSDGLQPVAGVKMVVQETESSVKNRKNEENLQVPEDVRKDEMLSKLRQESLTTICLAYMYAKNFEETGMDVTEKWVTAEQQADALEKYYQKGYDEGLQFGVEKGREYEQKKAEFMAKKETNQDPFFDNYDDIDANRFIRQNNVSEPPRNVVQPAHEKRHGKGKRKRHKR